MDFQTSKWLAASKDMRSKLALAVTITLSVLLLLFTVSIVGFWIIHLAFSQWWFAVGMAGLVSWVAFKWAWRQ